MLGSPAVLKAEALRASTRELAEEVLRSPIACDRLCLRFSSNKKSRKGRCGKTRRGSLEGGGLFHSSTSTVFKLLRRVIIDHFILHRPLQRNSYSPSVPASVSLLRIRCMHMTRAFFWSKAQQRCENYRPGSRSVFDAAGVSSRLGFACLRRGFGFLFFLHVSGFRLRRN